VDEIFPPSFALSTISYRGEYDEESEHALAGDRVRVEHTGDEYREDDADVHDDCKYHSAKVLYGFKNEKLPNCGANREGHHVEVHLWMSYDEFPERLQFLRVDERDKRKDHGKRVHRKHHMEWRKAFILVKHAALPLASERVEQ